MPKNQVITRKVEKQKEVREKKPCPKKAKMTPREIHPF
jgi:hypothetical protein